MELLLIAFVYSVFLFIAVFLVVLLMRVCFAIIEIPRQLERLTNEIAKHMSTMHREDAKRNVEEYYSEKQN